MSNAEYQCVYELPSGNYNVRPTINKVTYNLGTFVDQDQARRAYDQFLARAEHTLQYHGREGLEEAAAEFRILAARERAANPKTRANRSVEQRLTALRQEVDQLAMQVDLLKTRLDRQGAE